MFIICNRQLQLCPNLNSWFYEESQQIKILFLFWFNINAIMIKVMFEMIHEKCYRFDSLDMQALFAILLTEIDNRIYTSVVVLGNLRIRSKIPIKLTGPTTDTLRRL